MVGQAPAIIMEGAERREFQTAKVTSVKANFTTKRITIAFSIAINEDSLAAADELAKYIEKDAGTVGLTIVPFQPTLLR